MKYETYKNLTPEQKEEYDFMRSRFVSPHLQSILQPWSVFYLGLLVVSNLLNQPISYLIFGFFLCMFTPMAFALYENYKAKSFLKRTRR